jgi:hypothetical protein
LVYGASRYLLPSLVVQQIDDGGCDRAGQPLKPILFEAAFAVLDPVQDRVGSAQEFSQRLLANAERQSTASQGYTDSLINHIKLLLRLRRGAKAPTVKYTEAALRALRARGGLAGLKTAHHIDFIGLLVRHPAAGSRITPCSWRIVG